MCEIYFHFFNGFSGQIYFLDWLPMLYNSFFTSFPCLFTYSLEQDATVENSYEFPILYKAGQKEVYFNMKVFWRWILFSIWHGLTCFFLPMESTRWVLGDGRTSEHWYRSTIAFTMIVHLVTMKLFVESIFWNWLSILMAFVSLAIYYLILVIGSSEIFSQNFQKEATGLLEQEFGSLYFWMLALIGPFVSLLPDITYQFITSLYWPTPTQIICAEQKGIRENIAEKARDRARKRRSKRKDDYQETNKGSRKKIDDINGDVSEESEEEEEEEESEGNEQMYEEEEEEDEESIAPPPRKNNQRNSNRRKRNLDDYVSDHSDSEFDSLKKVRSHHPKAKASKDSMPHARRKRNTKQGA